VTRVRACVRASCGAVRCVEAHKAKSTSVSVRSFGAGLCGKSASQHVARTTARSGRVQVTAAAAIGHRRSARFERGVGRECGGHTTRRGPSKWCSVARARGGPLRERERKSVFSSLSSSPSSSSSSSSSSSGVSLHPRINAASPPALRFSLSRLSPTSLHSSRQSCRRSLCHRCRHHRHRRRHRRRWTSRGARRHRRRDHGPHRLFWITRDATLLGPQLR